MASYFCWETFPKGRKNETRKWKWRGETKALQMKNRLASPSSHLVNARPRWKVEEEGRGPSKLLLTCVCA